jgi:hypothetical protein
MAFETSDSVFIAEYQSIIFGWKKCISTPRRPQYPFKKRIDSIALIGA